MSRIAIVQHAPVVLDRDATLASAVALVAALIAADRHAPQARPCSCCWPRCCCRSS